MKRHNIKLLVLGLFVPVFLGSYSPSEEEGVIESFQIIKTNESAILKLIDDYKLSSDFNDVEKSGTLLSSISGHNDYEESANIVENDKKNKQDGSLGLISDRE